MPRCHLARFPLPDVLLDFDKLAARSDDDAFGLDECRRFGLTSTGESAAAPMRLKRSDETSISSGFIEWPCSAFLRLSRMSRYATYLQAIW